MIAFMLPDFLRDVNQYDDAAALWHSHWKEVVRKAGEENLWQSPWLTTAFADGTPQRDGNPIFSAVSVARRLAVRVIQLEPGDNPQEIYCWTDTFDEDSIGSIKQLVISCVLTEHTLSHAIKLMDQWIAEEEVLALGSHSNG